MKRFKYYIPLFIQSLFFIFFLPIYKFFIHLEINGKENIDKVKGPIIIASNHTSELDPTVIPLITAFFSEKLPVYSVIYPIIRYKQEDFGWRRYIYTGMFFELLGGYPLKSGSKDYEKSLDNHIQLLNQGKTVCIFPEGRYTTDGKMSPARGGLAYLAFKTKAVVVPIAINTFYGLSIKDFILRRRKVIVTVLDPINSDEIVESINPSVEDFRLGSQKVLDKISEVL